MSFECYRLIKAFALRTRSVSMAYSVLWGPFRATVLWLPTSGNNRRCREEAAVWLCRPGLRWVETVGVPGARSNSLSIAGCASEGGSTLYPLAQSSSRSLCGRVDMKPVRHLSAARPTVPITDPVAWRVTSAAREETSATRRS